ncbi:MAG: hypothetical protein JWO38_854 [Gemmataceae bacterium]|nr:hypothetical protein [Gemmataceae bacterium]
MTLRRLLRSTTPVWVVSIILTGGGRGTAADPVIAVDPKWDTARTTPPENLDELKSLQSTVKKVVDRCSPCTVGILIGMGAGSGVIVSDDGLVLTAAHVSGEPGKECTLVLPDGKRVKGKTLGTNDKLDSGMIRITDKGPNDGKWPYLPVGKSAELKKGQWLVSLGHPGGWKKDRPPVARLGQVQDTAKDLIRSNCTLVGGDSGGPLFDLDGNVVGIHSRIGYTLASNIHVPADVFKTEWDRLTKGEQVGKPAKPATASLGVVFDAKAEEAVLDEVTEDSPAAKAGLMKGDVITEFDGVEVATAEDVRASLRKHKPDDEVEVVVKRGTKTLTKTITLGKRGP